MATINRWLLVKKTSWVAKKFPDDFDPCLVELCEPLLKKNELLKDRHFPLESALARGHSCIYINNWEYNSRVPYIIGEVHTYTKDESPDQTAIDLNQKTAISEPHVDSTGKQYTNAFRFLIFSEGVIVESTRHASPTLMAKLLTQMIRSNLVDQKYPRLTFDNMLTEEYSDVIKKGGGVKSIRMNAEHPVDESLKYGTPFNKFFATKGTQKCTVEVEGDLEPKDAIDALSAFDGDHEKCVVTLMSGETLSDVGSYIMRTLETFTLENGRILTSELQNRLKNYLKSMMQPERGVLGPKGRFVKKTATVEVKAGKLK